LTHATLFVYTITGGDHVIGGDLRTNDDRAISRVHIMPFPDLPPCSVAHWSFSPENNERWRVGRLMFTETSRQWIKTSSELIEGGLEALDPKERVRMLLGREMAKKSGPVAIEFGAVGDCGSDG
ncbi:MAG: hypothetical protein ACJ8LM_16045, partial [Candidatus Udaeobacter sp.]